MTRNNAVARAGLSHCEVYESLRASIRSGKIEGGIRLKEVAVADQLSVSRTTLRQALWRLQAEGFVDFGTRVGFTVRRLDAGLLHDLVETILLILLAGADAAITQANVEGVLDVVGKWREPRPDPDCVIAHEQFEIDLAKLSGNAELPEMLSRLQALCHCARVSIPLPRAISHWTTILTAIEERKRTHARKAIMDCLQETFNIPLGKRESSGLINIPDHPVHDTAVVNRVYLQVRAKLINFEVRPGERIREEELATQTNSSRASVREALSRLVAEKLVAWEANRGFSVRTLNAKEIFDLFQLRSGLEAQMVALAIRRGNKNELTDFDRTWRSVYRRLPAMNHAQIIHEDEAFHERLTVLAGNRTLKRELDAVAARIHFIRGIDLRQSSIDWANEHNQISRAVAAGDHLTASTLMQAHVQRLFEDVHAALKIGVEQLYIR
jgi:DNA-binding GntR family transcriptional regulator